jgi:hypothetical protein
LEFKFIEHLSEGRNCDVYPIAFAKFILIGRMSEYPCGVYKDSIGFTERY